MRFLLVEVQETVIQCKVIHCTFKTSVESFELVCLHFGLVL